MTCPEILSNRKLPVVAVSLPISLTVIILVLVFSIAVTATIAIGITVAIVVAFVRNHTARVAHLRAIQNGFS